MKTQNSPKPIDEMNAAELQTASENVGVQIEADEREYSGLTAKMTQAAEAGLSEEWQRLYSLQNILPTKLRAAQLRLLSIRILMKTAAVEAAGVEVATTGAPLEGLQAAFETAKKQLQDAQWEHEDRYQHLNDTTRDLSTLKYERADL
jgi:hypothetical protein